MVEYFYRLPFVPENALQQIFLIHTKLKLQRKCFGNLHWKKLYNAFIYANLD